MVQTKCKMRQRSHTCEWSSKHFVVSFEQIHSRRRCHGQQVFRSSCFQFTLTEFEASNQLQRSALAYHWVCSWFSTISFMGTTFSIKRKYPHNGG